MPFRLLTNIEEFEALQPLWDALHRSNSNHSPFQAWEWNFAWWKHFGAEGRLRLVVVEDGTELIGIAPFHLRERFYGWPLPHLSFIGQKRTDYLDFIVAPGKEAPFFRELREFLKSSRNEWQFVELKDVPGESRNIPHLLRELASDFPLIGMELQRLCVTVPLTSDWESFLQSLGKRTRKDVGYDRRYLEKNFPIEFKVFTNSTAVFDGFRDLTRIYQTRWEEEKGAGKYAEDAVAKFEAEICERFSSRGDYRLYVLYADGKPVAGLSGYIQNGKYYGDTYAHSPELHKFSVGNVLLGMAIEDCINLQLKELDLSRGDESYKFRWNGQAKRNYHIKIFKNRFAAAKAALAEGIYERAAASPRLNRLQAKYRRLRYGAPRLGGSPGDESPG